MKALLLILVAVAVEQPADLQEATVVATYLQHRQDAACVAFPTAPCCEVGLWQIALLGASMAATGARHGIDPLILAAIAWHESKLLSDAIGPNGRDAGLLQISPRWVDASLEALLDPAINLEVGARVLMWWQSRPKYRADWLAHYAGGVVLEFRHSAFQGWVLGQVNWWRKEVSQ